MLFPSNSRLPVMDEQLSEEEERAYQTTILSYREHHAYSLIMDDDYCDKIRNTVLNLQMSGWSHLSSTSSFKLSSDSRFVSSCSSRAKSSSPSTNSTSQTRNFDVAELDLLRISKYIPVQSNVSNNRMSLALSLLQSEEFTNFKTCTQLETSKATQETTAIRQTQKPQPITAEQMISELVPQIKQLGVKNVPQARNNRSKMPKVSARPRRRNCEYRYPNQLPSVATEVLRKTHKTPNFSRCWTSLPKN